MGNTSPKQQILYAIEHKKPREAEKILKGNEELVHAFYNRGTTTLLCRAVFLESIECVKVLVEAGAYLERNNSKGETPFLIASRVGNVEILEYLKEKGSDLKAVDGKQNNALDIAVLN